MSGGYFDYDQHRIKNTYESIQEILDRQGREIPRSELYNSDDFYNKYPEEKYYETYPIEIWRILEEGIDILKKAKIYAHRIDYYLSGDNGEERFIERLVEDLNKLNKD